MNANEFVQRQQSALSEVQRLTCQLESGEISEAEGMARIESVMQALETQTSTYQRQRRLAWARPRVLWRMGAAVLLVLAVVALLYVRQTI